ncbi:MAG: D-hexose-6-phosphate mutarotase, partial [Cellvibrio sp.]
VYHAIDNTVSISGSPNIEITHSNCPSVVVWNPGSEAAAKIADIGEGQEQFYICVERGAVLSEKWHLPAGTSKSAWMEFKQI